MREQERWRGLGVGWEFGEERKGHAVSTPSGKPFQFNLRSLLQATAAVAILAAVLARVLASPVAFISVVFPVAAALGISMLLFAARHFGTR